MSNQCEHGQLARVCPLCEKDEHIRVLREALEDAKCGLLWYMDMYPESVSETDTEAMQRIEAALEQTK